MAKYRFMPVTKEVADNLVGPARSLLIVEDDQSLRYYDGEKQGGHRIPGDAPTDGGRYARQNGAWSELTDGATVKGGTHTVSTRPTVGGKRHVFSLDAPQYDYTLNAYALRQGPVEENVNVTIEDFPSVKGTYNRTSGFFDTTLNAATQVKLNTTTDGAYHSTGLPISGSSVSINLRQTVARFNGVSSQVDLGDINSPKTSWFLVLSFRLNDVDGYHPLFTDGGGSSGVEAYVKDGRPIMALRGNGVLYTLKGNISLYPDQFYHLAMGYDEASQRAVLYVDGNRVALDTMFDLTGDKDGTNGTYIGYTGTSSVSGEGTGFYFLGDIAEVRVYQTFLTSTDVDGLMKGIRPLKTVLGEWFADDLTDTQWPASSTGATGDVTNVTQVQLTVPALLRDTTGQYYQLDGETLVEIDTPDSATVFNNYGFTLVQALPTSAFSSGYTYSLVTPDPTPVDVHYTQPPQAFIATQPITIPPWERIRSLEVKGGVYGGGQIGLLVSSDGEQWYRPTITRVVSGYEMVLFGGKDSVTDFGDIDSPSVTGNLSLEVRFYTSNTSGYQPLFSDGGGSYGVEIGIENGVIVVAIRHSSGVLEVIKGNTVMDANRVYHAVGVIDNDAGEMEVYLDGVLDSGVTEFPTRVDYDGSDGTNIAWSGSGSPYTDGRATFSGGIANVTVWTQPLTADQVTRLFDGGDITPTPFARWTGESFDGETWKDTVNAHDGIVRFPLYALSPVDVQPTIDDPLGIIEAGSDFELLSGVSGGEWSRILLPDNQPGTLFIAGGLNIPDSYTDGVTLSSIEGVVDIPSGWVSQSRDEVAIEWTTDEVAFTPVNDGTYKFAFQNPVG